MSGTTIDDETEESTEETNAESEDRRGDGEADHLDDVDDGCGCTEVWEHLSEQRDDAE